MFAELHGELTHGGKSALIETPPFRLWRSASRRTGRPSKPRTTKSLNSKKSTTITRSSTHSTPLNRNSAKNDLEQIREPPLPKRPSVCYSHWRPIVVLKGSVGTQPVDKAGKPVARRDVYRMVLRIATAARTPRHVSPHSLRRSTIANALGARFLVAYVAGV